jgi:hypothetical protein
VLPTKGTLGYDNAHIVTPQDIWRSVLYDRTASVTTAIQMPPLARNLIDTNAVTVMAAWINSLSGGLPSLAPPVLVPAGGTFNGMVQVTASAPDTNAVLYYTLDGTLPTTNSLVYAGPVLVTNSLVLTVNAYEAGHTNSVATNGLYIILPPVYFTGGGVLTNGTFQVQLSGTVNKTYILQATTDFTNWVPVNTNVPLASPFLLFDPGASNFPARYYRAQQQ